MPALLACLHDLHQFPQRVQALGEARVGIELHQHFLGLAEGHARVQPLVQRGVELGHVTRGHEGCNEWNGPLLGGKGVRGRPGACRRSQALRTPGGETGTGHGGEIVGVADLVAPGH